MVRMLDLRNVLQLINDGFGNHPLAEQQFVRHRQQTILHVRFQARADAVFSIGDQLQPEAPPQLLKQLLG